MFNLSEVRPGDRERASDHNELMHAATRPTTGGMANVLGNSPHQPLTGKPRLYEITSDAPELDTDWGIYYVTAKPVNIIAGTG